MIKIMCFLIQYQKHKRGGRQNVTLRGGSKNRKNCVTYYVDAP